MYRPDLTTSPARAHSALRSARASIIQMMTSQLRVPLFSASASIAAFMLLMTYLSQAEGEYEHQSDRAYDGVSRARCLRDVRPRASAPRASAPRARPSLLSFAFSMRPGGPHPPGLAFPPSCRFRIPREKLYEKLDDIGVRPAREFRCSGLTRDWMRGLTSSVSIVKTSRSDPPRLPGTTVHDEGCLVGLPNRNPRLEGGW